mmetsp:Transcript_10218/g.12933  ORF Transcript_10218/g.12933 Transcript_10218/m.12933 type:complete len:515 (-) Transcript_10218:223-1767(-)
MYSNYYSTKTKKNSNILRFTPEGFKYSIDVPFPGRVLPVCARCKKNYKTREHCRTKECHTGLPWNDTFLCITLDASCTGPDNKLLDGPFMAQGVSNTAYQYATEIDPKTPSCGPCKEKNYTRTYCRSNKKHRALPWSTVYVMLSLKPDGIIPPPDEAENPDIVKEMNAKRRKINSDSNNSAVNTTDDSKAVEGAETEDKGKINDSKAVQGTETEEKKEKVDGGVNDKDAIKNEEKDGKDNEETESNDPKNQTEDKDFVKEVEEMASEATTSNPFEEIVSSRTFLATVSVERSKIQWLEFDASQKANNIRMRDEMSQKMHEENAVPTFPPHYGMMHPPMGMPMGMGMNPNFHPGYSQPMNHHHAPHHLPPGKDEQDRSPQHLGNSPNPNWNMQPHGNWNMPPQPHHSNFQQQDMMYHNPMGFDPHGMPGMGYGFSGPPMMQHDGSNHMMQPHMGWGFNNYYGGQPYSGNMPQSYDNKTPRQSPSKGPGQPANQKKHDDKLVMKEQHRNMESSVNI